MNQRVGGQGRKKLTERARNGKETRKEQRGGMGAARNMQGNNIHIIGKLEREKEKQEIENLFKKVMMEYFPDLMSEQTTQL